MSTPTPLVLAVVDALAADPDALDQLAAALAPRLTALVTPTEGEALSTDQAARHASVHPRTIRRALAAGTLTGHTIAGRWRIDPESLDHWLKVGAPTSTTPTHHNGRNGSGSTAGVDAIAGTRRAA